MVRLPLAAAPMEGATEVGAPAARYPVTQDGRYFVVRGRLWRCTDPRLEPACRERLTRELMSARRAKQAAIKAGDDDARRAARQRVDAAKTALGERGPPWWSDGSPDYNRRMANRTPYAAWFEALEATST